MTSPAPSRSTPHVDLLETVLDHLGEAPWPSEVYDAERLAARTGLTYEAAQAYLSPERTFTLSGDEGLGFATGRRGERLAVVARRRDPHGELRPVEVMLFDAEGRPSGGESYMVPPELGYAETLRLVEVTPGPIAVCRFRHPTVRYYALLPFGPLEHGLMAQGDGADERLRAWVEAQRGLFVWETLEQVVGG